MVLIILIVIVFISAILVFSNGSENNTTNCQSSTSKVKVKKRYSADKEIQRIQKQDKIEEIAQSIRLVVTSYVDSIKEPYPYVLKKNISCIKENHLLVKEAANSSLYPEILKYAYRYMFTGKDRVLGRKVEYKKFYEEYTSNPNSISLTLIKDAVDEKYRKDLPPNLFDL